MRRHQRGRIGDLDSLKVPGMTWTAIDEYRAKVRERYYKLTPFRLGYVIGEADDERDLCPYETPHTIELFNAGHKAGQESRQRRQEREREGGT